MERRRSVSRLSIGSIVSSRCWFHWQFPIFEYHISIWVLLLPCRVAIYFQCWELRLISQYIFWYMWLNCSRLNHMCFVQVNRLSRCIPRYLTSSFWERGLLLRVTEGHVGLFSVKVLWTDLEEFALIRQVASHFSILFRCTCR